MPSYYWAGPGYALPLFVGSHQKHPERNRSLCTRSAGFVIGG